MICTAGEFTVETKFDAEPGTPPYCVAGQSFWFKVILGLSGVNTPRYNVGFFAGQQGNDPSAATAGAICSVATFPLNSNPPWVDSDGNACGDYTGADKTTIYTVTVDKIKVTCNADSDGLLLVPYALSYEQNKGTTTSCNGPVDVKNGAPSKCNVGSSTVNGAVQVFSGAYVDVTKVTVPASETQSFSFTAQSTDATAKVIALTDPTSWTPSPDDGSGPVGGTYKPTSVSAASTSVSIGPSTSDGISHNQKARFYINALATAKPLTITETPLPDGWEPTVDISCTNITGSPISDLDGDPGNRVITASLSTTNSAASCTITNYKKPKVQIQKTSNNGTGTFTYTLTNIATTSDSITTTTAGTAVVGIDNNYVTNKTQAVTITETTPSGWPTNPVSASCIDTNYVNSGNNSGAFGSLTNNVLTIPSTNLKAGAQILCSFVNTKPTVQIAKNSSNGTGTFTYALTNMTTSSDSIATVTAGTAANGISGNIVTSASTAVTVTETAPSGWPTNPVSVSCVDSNGAVSGNGAGSFGSLSGTVLTIATSNLRPAAQILCTFTNTLPTPTVRISKTSNNGTGTFGYTMTNLAAGTDSITTATAGTAVNGTANNVSVTTTNVTVTEGTVPVNWPSDPVSASCSDSNSAITGNPGSFGTLSGNVLTILPANLKYGAVILCSFVNTFKLPLLSILKSANVGNANPGQSIVYTVQIVNTGTGVGTSVVFTDDLSPYASFFLNSGAPFFFTDSSPASGLTLGTPEYSNNNALTWVYTPVSGGGGAPADYDGNITNWKIPMTGTIRPGGSFTLNYQVVVK